MEFVDKDLQQFWESNGGACPRRIPSDCRKVLFRKLQMLDAAHAIQDLRIPPNNRLKRLQGDRFGQYSIRVNDQWRLCFTWSNGEPKGVEFCDYH
ncbi:type II toxin-antitoxin system RelE/ParE family toxin [Enorma massiliensis]|uniref:type II toxin-antitoxin system RelE/ParE family toxin n=1 Tax=Enorma massiliensis TaxID=1472761 RepID=UPI00320B1093